MVDEDAWRRRLAALGLAGAEPVGRGVEGVVYRIDGGRVAKVWSARQVPELELMRAFYADLDAARPSIATPLVEDVLVVDGTPVTVERELPGSAMQDRLDVDAEDVPDWAVDAVVASLHSLAAVPATDAMRALPVVGESLAFRTPGDSFIEALLALVARRAAADRGPLRAALPDLDRRLVALAERLSAVPPVPDTVVHGDLFGANIHVDPTGRPVALLDFGFMTTAGDPRFDAGVTAAIVDMYGAHAQKVTTRLTAELPDRLGHDPDVLLAYRAAYAVVTCTLFGDDEGDGHFAWCVRQLRAPETSRVLGLRAG
jgi:aminoglycoside phosphotransferase (APT) family kinase protein